MRVDVLGVGFDDLDLTAAVDRILERLDRGERTFLITANPEFVMLARRDDELAHIAREADLVVPDGTGVAVASDPRAVALAQAARSAALRRAGAAQADDRKMSEEWLRGRGPCSATEGSVHDE